MRFAIIENGKVVNVSESESALSANWVQSDVAKIGDIYDGATFTTPDPVIPVPESVPALNALLAIDAAGLSSQYEAWANHADRTFAERAFIEKAEQWRRSSPHVAAGAAALGLSDSQIDDLFRSAAAIDP